MKTHTKITFFILLFFFKLSLNAQDILPEYFYIKENGRYGLIDTKGNVVVKPTYKDVPSFVAGNVFYVEKYVNPELGDKYFLMHMDGSLASKDTFDGVSLIDFPIEEWAFEKQKKWGVVNSDGKILIPFEYENLSVVQPGVIVAKRSGEHGYFLKEHSYEFTSLPEQDKYDYDYIGDGYFSYFDRKEGRYGIFYAFDGKFMLKPIYAKIKRVRYGQVILEKYNNGIGGIGVYDLNKMKFVVEIGKYSNIWMPAINATHINKGAYASGHEEDSLFLATKKTDNGQAEFCILTYSGEERKIGSGEDTRDWLFSTNSYGFYGGCAYFTGKEIGCIDMNGDLIIHPSEGYDWIGKSSEGLIPLGKSGKKGFVNFDGKVVIPFVFSEVNEFINGIAKVEQPVEGDDRLIKKGYIDREGNWIWSTIEKKKD